MMMIRSGAKEPCSRCTQTVQSEREREDQGNEAARTSEPLTESASLTEPEKLPSKRRGRAGH